MALAFVGQSAASVVIEKLISAAVSYVGTCGAGASAMQDEIERLNLIAPQIQAILAVVEGGQTLGTKQNEGLDAWLWQLRDAVEQAEDVLDEMEYYELEKAAKAGDKKVQQGNAPNSKRKANNILGNYTFIRKLTEGIVFKGWKGAGETSDNVAASPETLLQQRLREAVKALDNVAASSGTLLQLVSQLYNSDVKRQQEDEIRNARETSSFLTEDTICGRDVERKRIVEWLTKPTGDEAENASATAGKVSAFAIVGMGGLGKTTLAQFIYHDEKVRQCFDLVMWVCVSDQFDVAMLSRKILEAARVRDNLGDKSLNMIQEILKEKLISKKVLLVLDDVWTDDKKTEWDKLVAPLKFGQKGSKILLTTRMDSVVHTVASVLQCKKESIKLGGLKQVDFMDLFNKHAFAGVDIDAHRNLKLIGEQIAKKLGGCPLAAKIMGGCLNSCMDEKYWRRILNENFLNLQESEDNIRMILRLSYHHLPASVQICFRYCSIFPKDRKFEKNELINMWICSGLIKKTIHEKRALEDIGEEYLNHLAKKSLFDVKIFESGSYREQKYVMHDLLHDLAQLVSSGECLGINGDGFGDIPKTIRHIYVDNASPLLMISHLKNLRTLIIYLNQDYDAVVFNDVLKRLKRLRLLQVTEYSCKFTDEVGNLIHLRFLSYLSGIYGISILPQSVCRLYHLEIMKLPGMTKIDDSTLDEMSNLVKLRLLHIGVDKMGKIPWIGKVTSLQELGDFHVREERGYDIGQLKGLQNLRKLGIKGLENVRSSEEGADANLIEKKNLDELSLGWSWIRSGGLEVVDEPLLDNLRPHANLKKLNIYGYTGVRSPDWMTVTYLSNIMHINLMNCERWENLPTLGQLPLLGFLYLTNMPAVKKLWCSTSTVDGCAFPSLEELRLEDMPNLESFKGEHMFPLLNKLEINSCPRLKGLPALPPTLKQLEIEKVGLTSLPMMQQDCSSGEGRASCSSSSSSHPALSKLIIRKCPSLTSLDGFMLQKQQYFSVLASLSIEKCENLRHLPEKFFQKLPFLKRLHIDMTTHGIILDNRLPETLEELTLVSNGDLDLSLLEESSPKLTALVFLENLPPFGQLPFLKYLHLRSMPAVKKLWCSRSTVGGCAFPSLQKLQLEDMPELESFEGEHMFPRLNRLYIEGCPSLKGLPALPLTLNLLVIERVGLTSLPMMQQDRSIGEGRASCSSSSSSSSSSSHSALSKLIIRECPDLTSLDGFMLQDQQYFPALASLSIEYCENLRHLPKKFFLKLPSFNDLTFKMCPKLIFVSSGDLDLSLLEESSPTSLYLGTLRIEGCASMTSLPPAGAFPSLSNLFIRNCKELSSLDGLQALPSLTFLSINGCDKLVELSLLQPPVGLTDMLLRPPMGLRYLSIDRHALLRLEPLRNLHSISRLIICDGTELTSLDEQWLLQNRNSLEGLTICKASSLVSLPPSMIDLQALRDLRIHDAPLLRTIPEPPTSLVSLQISGCRPELKDYIEGSGKFANIPYVRVTENYY